MKTSIKKRSTGKWHFALLMLVSCSLLVASCKGSTNAPKNNQDPPMENREIEFTVLAQGAHSNYDAQERLVISSQAELDRVVETLNQNTTPGMDMPEVDFSLETVVFATAGQLSSGGYTVAIDKIIETEDSVEVYVGGTSPAPGDYVTTVMTSPFVLVSFKAPQKPVVFAKGN